MRRWSKKGNVSNGNEQFLLPELFRVVIGTSFFSFSVPILSCLYSPPPANPLNPCREENTCICMEQLLLACTNSVIIFCYCSELYYIEKVTHYNHIFQIKNETQYLTKGFGGWNSDGKTLALPDHFGCFCGQQWRIFCVGEILKLWDYCCWVWAVYYQEGCECLARVGRPRLLCNHMVRFPYTPVRLCCRMEKKCRVNKFYYAWISVSSVLILNFFWKMKIPP